MSFWYKIEQFLAGKTKMMTKTVNDTNFEAWVEYLRTTKNLRTCVLDWNNHNPSTEFQKSLPSSDNEPEVLRLQIATQALLIVANSNHTESFKLQWKSLYKLETAKILASLSENPCIKELSLEMELEVLWTTSSEELTNFVKHSKVNSLTITGPIFYVPKEPIVNLYQALTENNYLKSLKLSGYTNFPTQEIAAWISYVIQNNQSLGSLALSNFEFNESDISCILRALNSNNTLRRLELSSLKTVSLSASSINAFAANLSLNHLKIGSVDYELGGIADIGRVLNRNKWLKIYSDYLLLLAILHQNKSYFPKELLQLILIQNIDSEKLTDFFADQFNNALESLKKSNPTPKAKPLPQRLNPIIDLTIYNETDLHFCIEYLRTNQLQALCLSNINTYYLPKKSCSNLMESLLGLGKNLEVLEVNLSKMPHNFFSCYDISFSNDFIPHINTHLVSLKSLKCTGLNEEKLLKLLLELVDHPSLEELNLEIPELYSYKIKEVLIKLIKHSKLTSLSLSFLMPAGFIAIPNFLPDIFQAVENNTYLRHFKFTDFGFSVNLAPFCTLITHNRSLKSLDLRNLKFNERDIEIIVACLVANPTLESLDLRGNNTLPFELSPSAIKSLEANHKLTYLKIDHLTNNEEIDRILLMNSGFVDELKVAELSSNEPEARQSSEESKVTISEPDQGYPLLLQICKAIAIFTITASFVGLIVASTLLTGGLAAGVLVGCSAAFLLGSFGLFEVERREEAIYPALYSESCFSC